MAVEVWALVLVAAELAYLTAVRRWMSLGHLRLLAVSVGGTVLAVVLSVVAIRATDATVGEALLLAGLPVVFMAFELVRTAIAVGRANAAMRASDRGR